VSTASTGSTMRRRDVMLLRESVAYRRGKKVSFHMSELRERAIEAARSLPADMQDAIARLVLQLTSSRRRSQSQRLALRRDGARTISTVNAIRAPKLNNRNSW
jgi:hypothetical protein